MTEAEAPIDPMDHSDGLESESEGNFGVVGEANTETNYKHVAFLGSSITQNSEDSGTTDTESEGSGNSGTSASENLQTIRELEYLVQQTGQDHPDAPRYREELGIAWGEKYTRTRDMYDLQNAVRHFQAAVDLTPPGDAERPKHLQNLGIWLTDRYWSLGDQKDLEAALQANQEAVDLTAVGDTERPGRLHSLAVSLAEQYRRLGDLNDLEAALKSKQEAVDLTPVGHAERPARLQSLGSLLTDQYWRVGGLEALEAAVQAHQEVVQLTPAGHPERPARLQSLGASLAGRYRRLGDLKDLEAALQSKQEAVDLTPVGHAERAGWLLSLGASLADQYRRLGDLKGLKAALQSKQEAVDLTPVGHAERPGRLQSLGVSLTDRYQRLGDLEDLEAALQSKREAVDLTPVVHAERAGRLQSLGVSLTDRYRRLGNLKDLEAALHTKQEAVDLTPVGHAERPGRLQSLGVSLIDRYRRLGDLKDLEAALQTTQEAVDLTPVGHAERPGRLQSLAGSLSDRYQRLGDLKDLEAALQADQEVVQLTPVEHAERPGWLQNLSVSLTDRYQRLGDLKDLEAALQTQQEAVDLTPVGHTERPGRLQSLGACLTDRYQRLGDLEDLEAALQTQQEAVDLTPVGHAERPGRLQSLGALLTGRYRRLEDLKDLEAALQSKQEAVDLTPVGHAERPGRLQSLGISLMDRYRRLGDLKDLEAALQTTQQAVKLTPVGHAERPWRLYSLGGPLLDRYRRLGNLKDLEAAVQADQEAVQLTPVEHPERPSRLQNLGASLTDQYQSLGNSGDLEAALQVKQEAVNLTLPDHPNRPVLMRGLAASLIDRYWKLRDPKDLEVIHTTYTESFKLSSANPQISWEQALRWAYFARDFLPSDWIPAFQAAFDQLPEILWLGNPIAVRHDAIYRLDIPSITSLAVQACIHLCNLDTAVELLERGLAIIFQQMLQLKTDVNLLPPDVATTLLHLSSQLHSEDISDPITVADKRNKLLKKVRNQPGLEYFLLPKSYNILCEAAYGGPVVILTSTEYQCDGIILLNPTMKPVHVPLPTVTSALLNSHHKLLKELLGCYNIRDRGQVSSSRLFGRREQFTHKPIQEHFEDMLNWLWMHVVNPIYMVLKLYEISSGRLWWLPTGSFVGLPWHASAPTDQFIHSYTTTLESLLNAYAKIPSGTTPKLGLVGVTHTGSNRANSLQGVEEEVNKIVSIVEQHQVQSLVGEQATVDAVKIQLEDCSWIHLACHGHQDLIDPTKSHLQLYGGNLELDTILRMPLPKAQFVFLAACQTGMGDTVLVNESFHLGGGFITAGFQSAIATMWSMNDMDGPTVAETVYSHLFYQGQKPQVMETAEALQLAVKELKQRKVPYERWVPTEIGGGQFPLPSASFVNPDLSAKNSSALSIWQQSLIVVHQLTLKPFYGPMQAGQVLEFRQFKCCLAWIGPEFHFVLVLSLTTHESIWELKIQAHGCTPANGMVIWEMPINVTTQAPNANRHPQGLNCFLEGIGMEFCV
ncbi:CHAT domain-containing protein [Mycena capillaripes]|nr:CHAT domain-containing protein [Mycena capillaripes]